MQTKPSDRFFHPWHSLSVGENAPETVQSIIEIQQGSKAKYELDKPTGFLRLDRILSSHLHYPFHYGYIPQTYCPDEDPLDILIVCTEKLLPLSIVEATVLGAVKMIDGGKQDDKIIAVATHDPAMKQKKELTDLNEQILETIKHFFENYKKPEGKEVIIEKFLSKKEAQNIVNESIALYNSTFCK
ncbi:MAG: inorganic diphosphatase [Candidatus Babeliales bacterium]